MSDLINALKSLDITPIGDVPYVRYEDVLRAVANLQQTCNQLATDCISRQEAIETIRAMQTYKLSAGDELLLIDKAGVQTELMLLPSAQPEIIRCKDCKHQAKEWRADKRLKDGGYTVCGCDVVGDSCGYWALFGRDDDYCSMAERRTDGSDR